MSSKNLSKSLFHELGMGIHVGRVYFTNLNWDFVMDFVIDNNSESNLFIH